MTPLQAHWYHEDPELGESIAESIWKEILLKVFSEFQKLWKKGGGLFNSWQQ